jgi:hypothetical protein
MREFKMQSKQQQKIQKRGLALAPRMNQCPRSLQEENSKRLKETSTSRSRREMRRRLLGTRAGGSLGVALACLRAAAGGDEGASSAVAPHMTGDADDARGCGCGGQRAGNAGAVPRLVAVPTADID